MRLHPAESDAIARLIASVEARTGTQLLVAVVPRSDSYVELPWKAFALGASLAALGVVIADTPVTALLPVVAILGSGAIGALLAILVPRFARLFLREARSQAEVRQYAESLFLRHELFGTRGRTAVLILVSQFERRVEVVPDTGLRARVGDAGWQHVIEAMVPHLRETGPFHALEAGIAYVERLLTSKGFHAAAGTANELPNRPIEESGA